MGGSPGGGPPPAGASGGPGATTQVFYHRNLATYFMKRRDYGQAAEQLRLANERQKLPKNYLQTGDPRWDGIMPQRRNAPTPARNAK